MQALALFFTNRFKSFGHAINGLPILFKEEPNAKIQVFCAVIVVLCGFYFSCDTWEWMILVACIGSVMAMECINTAIENLSDIVDAEYNLGIKKVKDLAAASVLIVSISSFIISCLVFLPKIILYF